MSIAENGPACRGGAIGSAEIAALRAATDGAKECGLAAAPPASAGGPTPQPGLPTHPVYAGDSSRRGGRSGR